MHALTSYLSASPPLTEHSGNFLSSKYSMPLPQLQTIHMRKSGMPRLSASYRSLYPQLGQNLVPVVFVPQFGQKFGSWIVCPDACPCAAA